jgi:predicted transcriptional regulator of viral defense system
MTGAEADAQLLDVQTLTEELIVRNLASRVLSDVQLSRVVVGTDQRRYHLVNRATKAGELHRLQRGLYVLDSKYRDSPPHPFALAQALGPGSYVSFETALAHHGWIPEAVRTVASVTPGRKSSAHEHSIFGSFSFYPLAIQAGYFLELVERLQIQQQTMLVARPIRALMDLVCLRKVEWQGMAWILAGLRIDPDALRSVTSADFRTLELIYKQKRVRTFLKSFARELGHD